MHVLSASLSRPYSGTASKNKPELRLSCAAHGHDPLPSSQLDGMQPLLPPLQPPPTEETEKHEHPMIRCHEAPHDQTSQSTP